MSSVKLPSPAKDFPLEKYQEFLDALRIRASQQPVAPVAPIAVIENSEHKQAIFNCLANNWSAGRIHAYLLQTVQVDIPTAAIQQYRDSLDKDAFLPISFLQSKFKELDIEVDAIGELARLLKLKAERLDLALFLESVTFPLHSIVDQQLREYWDLLKEYLAIQKGLGFFAVDTVSNAGLQNVLPANMPPGEIPSIRHLLELRIISEKPSRSQEPINADARVLE